MKNVTALIISAFVAGCASNGGGGSQPPIPSPPTAWQFFYSNNVSGSCSDFNFPATDGVHYCVRGGIAASQGQSIRATFTLSGSGALYPTSSNEPLPATVHLMLWRRNDNMSCAGSYQQYRLWAGRTEVSSPGTYTIEATISPENWTDCYGQPGSANPAAFADTVNNLAGIGITFGGAYYAGHGVAANGPVHFHIDNFSIDGRTYGKKQKRKR